MVEFKQTIRLNKSLTVEECALDGRLRIIHCIYDRIRRAET